MKHLIIYAHPRQESLNHSILYAVKKAFDKSGNEVVIRNLYKLNFQPVLTGNDLAANMKGQLPEDIKTEQQYISWADQITVIYPIWWTGLPAILKGYFDRVLLYGFAYQFDEKGLVKLLTGKKALLFTTHGMPKAAYDPMMYQAFESTVDKGIFDFCGIEVLEHKYFASATSAPKETLETYIIEAEQIAEKYSGK